MFKKQKTLPLNTATLYYSALCLLLLVPKYFQLIETQVYYKSHFETNKNILFIATPAF